MGPKNVTHDMNTFLELPLQSRKGELLLSYNYILYLGTINECNNRMRSMITLLYNRAIMFLTKSWKIRNSSLDPPFIQLFSDLADIAKWYVWYNNYVNRYMFHWHNYETLVTCCNYPWLLS